MLALLLAALVAQDRPAMLPAPDTIEPLTAAESCKLNEGEEITVCGRSRPSPYRIQRLEPRFTEKPVRAQVKIPGLGTARVYAEQRAVGTGGASAPAAMVSLAIPLGGKKKPRK
jgi:hypothetical protein